MLGVLWSDSLWGVMLIEVTCVGPWLLELIGAGRLVHRLKLGLSICKGLVG
jgi:hypothetical protein